MVTLFVAAASVFTSFPLDKAAGPVCHLFLSLLWVS